MESLSKYLPISELSSDFWITSYDTITFGYQFEMPEVYTLGILEASSFYEGFTNALKKLGNNVIVQKYSLFYTSKWESQYKGDSITRKWNDRKFDNRPIMDVDQFIFVSFYFGKQNLASNKNIYSGKKLKKIVDRSYSSLTQDRIFEYRKQLAPFEISMGLTEYEGQSSGGLCPVFKRMDQENMLHFLERYLSMDLRKEGTYDYVQYDFRDGFRVGSRNVSILSMRDMPSSFNPFTTANGVVADSKKYGTGEFYTNDMKMSTSFLFPLGIGLPCAHILAETYILINTERIEAILEQELSEIRFLTGLGRMDAIDKRDVVNQFIADTPRLEYSCCKYGFAVLLPHEKSKKVELTTSVIDIASTMGVKLYDETRGNLKAFMFNLPGAGHALADLKLGWLEAYVRATTLESYKNGNREGIQFVDLFGKPFLFDFWDEKTKYLEARNGMLFAPTGGGKSFLTNHLLDSCFDQGDYIYIIDVGGSYIRTTELNKGLYFDSKILTSFSFNPFDMCTKKLEVVTQSGEKVWQYYPTKNSKNEDDPFFVDFLAMLVISIWYRSSGTTGLNKASTETKELLKDSIKLYYLAVNKGKIREINFDSYYHFVLSDFINELKNEDSEDMFSMKSFKLMCRPFIKSGDYGFLLNAEKHISLDNRWACFDLVGLANSEDLKTPVMLILMNLVQSKLETLNGKRMRFFIDEAVDMLENPVFGDFLGGLYRKIRKMGGQVFIITQSIRYLDNLEPMISSSIFSNSHIKILLDHSADKEIIPTLQEKLSLTDAETALLYQMRVEKTRPYRIVFMKFGNLPGFLFRHEVSLETFAAYQTNPKEISQINEIKNRTGSIIPAIETFVENQTNSIEQEIEESINA